MVAKQAQLLVVAAHPDDAEFGISGTVARWTREGKEVAYAVCTNGDKGTSDTNMKPETLAKTQTMLVERKGREYLKTTKTKQFHLLALSLKIR